jgi:hypothetical protein
MPQQPREETTNEENQRLELQVQRVLGRVQDFPSPLELADELTRLTEQLEKNRNTLDRWADKFFYLVTGILGAVGMNAGVIAFKPPQINQPPPVQVFPEQPYQQQRPTYPPP